MNTHRCEVTRVEPYHPRRCPECGDPLRTGALMWGVPAVPRLIACSLDCCRALKRRAYGSPL